MYLIKVTRETVLIRICAVSVTEAEVYRATGSRSSLRKQVSDTTLHTRGVEFEGMSFCLLKEALKWYRLRYPPSTESLFKVGIKAVLISHSAVRKATLRRL